MNQDSIDLLKWLEENAAELVAEDYSIADTGDYSTVWVVYDHAGSFSSRFAIGSGDTPARAIQDAIKNNF